MPIDHEEGINVSKERVYSILSSASKLYTIDKKNLLYHFNLQEAIDLSLLYSMTEYDRLETQLNVISLADAESPSEDEDPDKHFRKIQIEETIKFALQE